MIVSAKKIARVTQYFGR